MVGIAILKRMIKEGCTELTFEQNPEKDKEASYVDLKDRSIPGRISNKCKGPGATSWCTEDSREAKMV